MAVRGFSDRREPAVVKKGELRSKAALEHHVMHDHGFSRMPESGTGEGDVAFSWLKWHHDVDHDSDLFNPNVPHEH